MALRQTSRLPVALGVLVATALGASMGAATSTLPGLSTITSASSTSVVVPRSLSSTMSGEVVTLTMTSTVTALAPAAYSNSSTSNLAPVVPPMETSPQSTTPTTTPATQDSILPTAPVCTPPANATKPYGWVEDDGPSYGNLIVRNNCAMQLTAWSVGARLLQGYKSRAQGYYADGENTIIIIPPGGNHTEPFRINPPDVPGLEKYSCAEDKIAGQGVSFKISKTDLPVPDIFQFEYSLVKDLKRGDDRFYRMNYDISLLDCAQTEHVTDFTGTAAQHEDKLEKCPGYDKGVAVTFDTDTDTKICPPIYCDGIEQCMMIYTWDRTRQGEMSLACEQEYRGNMIVDLCVNGNEVVNGQALALFDQWASTASNLPSGVLKTGAQLPASMTQSSVPTSPVSISIPSTSAPSTFAPVAARSAPSFSLSTSPSLAHAADIRQEPPLSTPHVDCVDGGDSTLKTCYTTSLSTYVPEITFPTITEDMAEETSTEIVNAPQSTGETEEGPIVPNPGEIAAVIITIETFSTENEDQ